MLSPVVDKYFKKNASLFFLLFIASLIVLLYKGVYDNYIYRDDTGGFYAGYVLSKDILNIFNYNFEAINMTDFNRYIVILSYLPNYLLGGINPKHYYTFNILLHILNCIIVFCLCRRITSDVRVPFLCTLIFAISMDRADAIMMVAHRTTLLGAFSALFLSWFYLFLFSKKIDLSRLLLFMVLYSVLIFTYETSIMIPFVVFLLTFFLPDEAKRNKFIWVVNIYAFFLSAFLVVYFGLSSRVDFIHQGRNILAAIPPVLIPGKYLQVSYENSTVQTYLYSNGTTFGLLEFLGIVLLLSCLVYAFLKRSYPVLFGVLFFIVFAFPSSSHPWGYYPEIHMTPDGGFSDEGYMRWSIGKFTYLASFGSSVVLSVLWGSLYQRYKMIDFPCKKFFVISILATYVGINAFFISERESQWDFITNESRFEVDYAVKNKDELGAYDVVLADAILSDAHFRNILKVITANEKIEVYPTSEFRKYKTHENTALLIRQGDRMILGR